MREVYIDMVRSTSTAGLIIAPTLRFFSFGLKWITFGRSLDEPLWLLRCS